MTEWKDELKWAFEAPAAERKRVFLRQLVLPRMTVGEFLLSQVGYIRKLSWGISALILVGSVLGLAFLREGTVIWLISGLTPFLALVFILESGRSELCHMDELEMTTRFSLKTVTLARVMILGMTDAAILCMLLPIGLWNHTAAPLTAALYMITPFLFTVYSGLLAMRKLKGRDAMYACVGISVSISLAVFLSHQIMPCIYQQQCVRVWTIAALALAFGNGKQCMEMINRKGELAWN